MVRRKLSKKNRAIAQVVELELRKMTSYSALMSTHIATKLGMNSTDMEVADLLSWNGPLSAGELMALSGLTSGAVTGVVDRLEAAGMVTRTINQSDKRKICIELDYSGVKKVVALYKKHSEETERLLATYTESELQLLASFLEQINQITKREIGVA